MKWKNKQAQSGLFIGLIGFWLVLSLMITLFNAGGLSFNSKTNINVNQSSVNLPSSTVSDSAGFMTGVWNFFKVIFSFIGTLLAIMTFYFPDMGSAWVNTISNTVLLVLKVATWWVIIRFWV